jgi:hypothetical protein
MTKGHQKPATEEEVVETTTTDKEPSVPELESEAEKPGPVEEVVEEPEKPKAEKLKITERLFRSRISFCQKKHWLLLLLLLLQRNQNPQD